MTVQYINIVQQTILKCSLTWSQLKFMESNPWLYHIYCQCLGAVKENVICPWLSFPSEFIRKDSYSLHEQILLKNTNRYYICYVQYLPGAYGLTGKSIVELLMVFPRCNKSAEKWKIKVHQCNLHGSGRTVWKVLGEQRWESKPFQGPWNCYRKSIKVENGDSRENLNTH